MPFSSGISQLASHGADTGGFASFLELQGSFFLGGKVFTMPILYYGHWIDLRQH